MMVATVEGTGGSAVIYTQHTDHLTGASGVTDSNGDEEQVLDYYPFGDIRVNDKAGTFDEQRKFTGHEYDDDTGLTYMNARYYHSGVGRFMSQDVLAHSANPDLLLDPQQLNYYSYVRNNPLIYNDPSGNGLSALLILALEVYDAVETAKDIQEYKSEPSLENGADVIINLAMTPVPGGALVSKPAKKVVKEGIKATKPIAKKVVSKAKTVLFEGTQMTKNQIEKTISSYWAKYDEHIEKLQNYILNPEKYDNKGLLKGKSQEERARIITGRVETLKKDINMFVEKIEHAKNTLNLFD